MLANLLARATIYALILHLFLGLASNAFRHIVIAAATATMNRSGEAAVPFAALSAAMVATNHLSPKIIQVLRNRFAQPATGAAAARILVILDLSPTSSILSHAVAAVHLLIQGLPAFTVAVTFAHAYKVDVSLHTNLAILHLVSCFFHHVFYFTHRRDAGIMATSIDRIAIHALVGRAAVATAIWGYMLGVRIVGECVFWAGRKLVGDQRFMGL